MRKIIATAVLCLLVILATACGTASSPGTDRLALVLVAKLAVDSALERQCGATEQCADLRASAAGIVDRLLTGRDVTDEERTELQATLRGYLEQAGITGPAADLILLEVSRIAQRLRGAA